VGTHFLSVVSRKSGFLTPLLQPRLRKQLHAEMSLIIVVCDSQESEATG